MPTYKRILYNEQWYEDIRFTGYSYADENQYECLVCGEHGHTYEIRSTTLDEMIAAKWKDAIVASLRKFYGNDSERMNREYRGKMIGVMYAGGRWYASHSGPYLEWEWIQEAMPKGLRYWNFSDEEPVKTWGGVTIDHHLLKECQAPNSPGILQCAGAKLARYVASFRVCAPVYMTEMWVKPNGTHTKYEHGKITQSCATCCEQIATLMCPHTPQQLWRYGDKAQIFPPYTDGESQVKRAFQLLEDISAYTEPWPTSALGFTLKKGSTIQVDGFRDGYYQVSLQSGWAIFHCTGSPAREISGNTVGVPPMYVDAGFFKKTLMDLLW